jgi:predicted metalloprotease with PDZ domain
MRVLGCALVMAACSSAVPPPAPAPCAVEKPPPPAAPHLRSGTDVSYTVELAHDPFPFVRVTLLFYGGAAGVTHVGLDDWGGVEHAELAVRGVRAFDAAGNALSLDEKKDFEHTKSGPTWTVRHAAASEVRVEYALLPLEAEVVTKDHAHFRPILTPSYFHAIGHTALFDVRELDHEKPLAIEFHWKGWTEAGMNAVSSFSTERDFSTTTSLRSFRHAVFFAGDVRVEKRTIGPTQAPLWLAIAGHDWSFSDAAITDLAASVATAQRSFFGDYDWPYFLISILPTGKREGHSLAGTGLTTSFATFLSPSEDLKTSGDGTGVAWLFSHELFHMWNGGRYELSEPEAESYWFSEGFTNFYARRLLVRSGLLDPRSGMESLNDAIRRYTLSPLKRATASKVGPDFFKDSVSHDLPYARGEVVALLVDSEIRRVSRGAKSLDDLMVELLAKRQDKRPKLTPEHIFELVSTYTSRELAERVRAIAVSGDDAQIDPRMLAPCVARTDHVGPFDLGLDEVEMRKGVVAGVAPGSNAYGAGLRNGQHRKQWSYSFGNPMHAVEVTIVEGGKEREIQYLPQGKPVPIIAFDLPTAPDQAAACARRL